MRRAGNLFPKIHERENLRLACWKALRGKRDRAETRTFLERLDENLAEIAEGLRNDDYPLGRSTQFRIHDPKERLITAPCFAERVIHHSIVNVCEPEFERWLIDDSYACRVGRGRVKAVERARTFCSRFGWFLKLDIRKYFDSISHGELLRRLFRRFKDPPLLSLFERIIGAHGRDMGRGLPIGSLMSQHFANFYLGWFDRFVKEELGICGFVRYMDDSILWADDSRRLVEALRACRGFLADELHLELKAAPYINRTRHGVDFLGCRVFGTHATLNHRSRNRFRRRMIALEHEFLDGRIGELELQQRATALAAFAASAGAASWRFRAATLQRFQVSDQEAARTA